MTDREAAIERVRAYVEACDYDDREIVNTAEDCDLTAGDLRALLSALELGRLDAPRDPHQPSKTPVTAPPARSLDFHRWLEGEES